MKRILLCVLCLLMLASCGKPSAQTDPAQQPDRTEQTQLPAQTDEGEVFIEPDSELDLSGEIEIAQGPAAKELSCTPLKKDGKVYGFEMRFRRTDAIETLMASAENFYFGVIQRGKKKIAVPTEEIRVLLDVPTNAFVLTLLMPSDKKLSGDSATVSFYISSRRDGASKALFAAQQTVDIS